MCWQINPVQLGELMGKGTPKQKTAVMAAMMKMNKMVIDDFEKAFEEAA